MNVTARIFQSILTTAHHVISGDDINNYYENFNGMLTFKDQNLFNQFHEIGESIAAILFQKKIGVLIMAYDTLAFCIRFQKNCTFHGFNLRLISHALQDIPKSTGDPIFLAGLDSLSVGFGWNPVLIGDFEEKVEIFPLIDFEGICFFYGTPRHLQSFEFHFASSQSLTTSQIPLSLSQNQNSSLTTDSTTTSQSKPSSQKKKKKNSKSQQNTLLTMFSSFEKD